MITSTSPRISTTLITFLTALALQWSVMNYLSSLSHQQMKIETLKLKNQITVDLARQLSASISANDDLAALIIIKSARTSHPQIQKAEVFDANGKILLHTDPGQMNKTTKPYSGTQTPVVKTNPYASEGRWLTEIPTVMPENDKLYFRAYFDDTRLIQTSRMYSVRFHLLILITSLLLAGFVFFRISRFELVDPRQRADLQPPVTLPKENKIQHIADLLLSEMRHAALAIDRDNKILAANTLALELLNCRAEELVGMHMFHAPLPKSLFDFYQTSIQTPEQVAQTRINLASKEPGLPIKLICAPASSRWELALISLA